MGIFSRNNENERGWDDEIHDSGVKLLDAMQRKDKADMQLYGANLIVNIILMCDTKDINVLQQAFRDLKKHDRMME